MLNYSHCGHVTDPREGIERLKDMLRNYPLDRMLEPGGFYEVDPFCYRITQDIKGIHYHPTVPRWPESPNTHSFCGNFKTYSFGFFFETDDADLIKELVELIDANMKREDYLCQPGSLQLETRLSKARAKKQQRQRELGRPVTE